MLALVLVVAACSPGGDDGDGSGAGDENAAVVDTPQTTRVPALEPRSAEELEISVDRAGRPYEVSFDPTTLDIDPRFATVLEIDERIRLLDGSALWSDPAAPVQAGDELRFPGTEQLRLTVLWAGASSGADEVSGNADEAADEAAGDDDESRAERVVGVRLQRPGAQIARWDNRAVAFTRGTVFGLITVPAVIDQAVAAFEAGEPTLLEPPTLIEPLVIEDFDERPGRETVLLGIGAGGGRFRYSAGFDEDGVAAALMVLDSEVPWRFAVPDGDAPPDVIEREDQLIDCIEGRRLIDKWGHCI